MGSPYHRLEGDDLWTAVQICDVQEWSNTTMKWRTVDTADAFVELLQEEHDASAEVLQEEVQAELFQEEVPAEKDLETQPEGFFKRPTWAIGG